MNGGNIDELVYYNKASLTDMSCQEASSMTEYVNGLLQNYPRIANYGSAVAMLWQHSMNFSSQLGLYFTSDVTKGFPEDYDTVAFSNVINADVALSKDRIFVVWQDNNSGTVKYKSGRYETRVGVKDQNSFSLLNIYPNPSLEDWTISGTANSAMISLELLDVKGRIIFSTNMPAPGNQFQVTIPNDELPIGIYFLRITDSSTTAVREVVKH